MTSATLVRETVIGDGVQPVTTSGGASAPVAAGAQAKSAEPVAVTVDQIVTLITDLHRQLVTADFEWASRSARITDQNPETTHYNPPATVTLTNVPNATPDETILINMDGYRYCAVQVVKTGGADTFTWTMEGSAEGALAGSAWDDVTQYGFTSLTAPNAASYTADGILCSIENAHIRGFKVKIATAGGANDADFKVIYKVSN